jgi:phosphatidylinositol alpha-1,6-mannosyltransferase
MGILVITWNFPPRRGGIENLLSNLCQELSKNHPLFVISSFASSAENREKWVFRPRWPGLVSFFIYALCQGSLLLWRNRGINVVLGGSAGVLPVVILLAKVFHRKSVVHIHGSDLMYSSITYQLLWLRWLGKVDRVVANSHYTASLALRKRANRDALIVIPPSVGREHFVPMKDEGGKREMGLGGRKVLLYVGRLARRKGVREFLERSLFRIVSEVPEVSFLIVGENPTDSLIHQDGDVLGELKDLVLDLKLQAHVRFLGGVSDAELTKIYRVSDLMVLPALSVKDDVEGFGIAIVEAAAAGRPCVATRVGGIPEAIEDGMSGILVEPEDYEPMSRAIVGLLRDDQRRLGMGEFAQRRAREEFSLEAIVKRYEGMFESLT